MLSYFVRKRTMPVHTPPSRRFFTWRTFFVLYVGGMFLFPASVGAQDFSQEALVDLVKPSVVRIGERITGTAKVPQIRVDIRDRSFEVVPDSITEISVDELLAGSGFIIHPDGYIATNAHVVSEETVKIMLASESALSALFENALFLSDEEMRRFLESDAEGDFSREVLRFVIDHSEFDLTRQVAVLRPNSENKNMSDLIAEGFPADIKYVNDRFLDDDRDIAILKIEEADLPALELGSSAALAVGKRVYIFGFPATAELGQTASLEATFTQGVISAIRDSTESELRIFQTDAKVSEGSSGGPLFNGEGEVEGVITFQTNELSRVSGDNFAFAIPIEVLTTVAAEHDVPLAEGNYSKNFKLGYDELLGNHCQNANEKFREAEKVNPNFAVSGYLETYFRRCEALTESGQSIDTRWEALIGDVRGLDNPIVYIVGIIMFLFGVFGAALFWLLRQVKREEHEIEVLEARLREDEKRMLRYQQRLSPTDAAEEVSKRRKTV